MDDRLHAKHAPRPWAGRWTWSAILLSGGVTVASASPPPSQAYVVPHTFARAASDELAVLTYNVKGLPWPVASGRDEAMVRIGERLAAGQMSE